ncbi:MAG: DivIVA domain-containing protein [Erysipelotrichaceae bacterium]|nr:DivIVA domain-containing protein [Erysipelotrichaceae bacterium]
MSNRINLDLQTILDKQFNIDFKGYNPAEVDGFLDLILEDYQVFQEIIAEQKAKIAELEAANNTLKNSLVEAQGKARVAEEMNGISNLDVIKRLSRLEQEVFKNQ